MRLIVSEFTQYVQPIITILAVVIGALITFFLNRRLEPFRADVGFKTKQKEIRYSKLYDMRLEALEGLHFRLTGVIDSAAVVVAFIQTVPHQEGKTIQERVDIDRNVKVGKVYEATRDLHLYHSQKSLYLPPVLSKQIADFHESLTRLMTEFNFANSFECFQARERLKVWEKAESQVSEAKKTRDELDRKFRELLSEEGLSV